jgi:hypothetical protein
MISPRSLSTIGKQLDATGNIGYNIGLLHEYNLNFSLYEVEKYHYDVGILHPGVYDSDALFDKDIWDNYVRIIITRVIAFIVWSLFFHVVNGMSLILSGLADITISYALEMRFSWFSFCYFGLALDLIAWVIVRITDISAVALSFRHSPITSIVLVGLLLFFASKHHTKQVVD